MYMLLLLGAIKIRVHTRDTTSVETQILYEKIDYLRNRTNLRSHQTDKRLSQLKEEGIEVISAELETQTLVVWIWCRTEAALASCQRMYESNQLRDKLFENIQPYISKKIHIDGNQFKKTIGKFLLTHS